MTRSSRMIPFPGRRKPAPSDPGPPRAPLVPLAGATLQVEILTAPGIMPSAEGKRPMFLFGIVGELVSLVDLVGQLPADASGVAAHVAGWLRPVIAQHGRPSRIVVRRADVAAALGEALAAERVPVRFEPRPAEVARMLCELRDGLGMPAVINLPSTSQAWGDWDVPAPILTAVFDAAAAYYRAAPWTLFDDRLRTTLTTASGATWSPIVLGGGGEVTGLALFEHAGDADLVSGEFEDDGDDTSVFDHLQGGIVQIDFNAEADLPQPMRREFRRARWPIAGPQAWPILMATNTLGGAVSPVQLVDLTDALGALARLATTEPDAVFEVERTATALAWQDDATGAALRIESRHTAFADRPWPAPAALAPCLPSGPGADPAAALVGWGQEDLLEDGVLVTGRFREWLEGRPAQRRTADRHEVNAELFVAYFLGRDLGIPVRAVTEYDLRVFLYDHLPRKVMQSRRESLDTLTSLRLFFQFLAEVEGIHAPWAAEPLANKDALAERLDTCPTSVFFEASSPRWRLDGDNDLHRRLLIHDGWLVPGVRFGEAIAEGFGGMDLDGMGFGGMGFDEAAIERELRRRWLIWRDELLAAASGGADGDAAPAPSAYRLFLALKERRNRWASEAQPALGGRSPLQVVRAERKASQRGSGRGRRRGRGGRRG